jgi:hypothetical protein
VFNWLTKAEQGISLKERFFQKGAVDSATTAAGEIKVAAMTAEQSHKNFRRVDTSAKGRSKYQQIARKVKLFHNLLDGQCRRRRISAVINRQPFDPVPTALRPEGPADGFRPTSQNHASQL